MTVWIAVTFPGCKSTNVVKNGIAVEAKVKTMDNISRKGGREAICEAYP